MINRRTFNKMGLAAILAPQPGRALAQEPVRSGVGYQIATIRDGRLTAQHGGKARAGLDVDDATLFQVASCSKTVTALAVLTLVRDGRLALDAPVNQSLTRWQVPGPRGGKVSAVELMSHTAGTTVHGFGGYGPSDDLPALLEILNGQAPANSGAVRARQKGFRPVKYSGGGTMVLQALIEDITGEAFSSYARRAVLEPVGAPTATFAITPRRAFAHGAHEDGEIVTGGFRRHPESAAAGLWATASDLARLLQAVLASLNRDRRALLPVELATRMITPVRRHAGLGLFVEPGRIIWHEGRNYGFDAIMAAELATGRVRAAVANRNGAIEHYARRLFAQ